MFPQTFLLVVYTFHIKFYFSGKSQTKSTKNLSTQGTLPREYVTTKGTLAREHVSTQDTLAREHVSTQGTLGRERVRHAI